MRRRRTDQERAEELLQEWAHGVEAALGYGFPPAPTPGRVQNGESTYSSPEQYAYYQHRHERLDRAVRRVADIDKRWKECLDLQYDERCTSSALMADKMGVSERTFRRMRNAAQLAFLREYKAIMATAEKALDATVSVG